MSLRGIKVLELSGNVPASFCGMILSDFGASVIRVDRLEVNNTQRVQILPDVLSNGKKSIAINFKHKKGIQVFRQLCNSSDVLVNSNKPGFMEKVIGIGQKELFEENPRLIYAHITGYGNNGSFVKESGHDINFTAMSGILSMMSRLNEKPFPHGMIMATLAGGSLLCTLGILAALQERTLSGKGQVIDSSITEGAAYLGSWLYRTQHCSFWKNKNGKFGGNGESHYYEVYETKDGKYMAVGALEPIYYQNLLNGLGLTEEECPQVEWEQGKEIFTKKFLEKTQDEWCAIFKDKNASISPVLSLTDAPKHEYNIERESFVPFSDNGKMVPRPAPLLSRTPAKSHAMKPQLQIGQHTEQILRELQYSEENIAEMIRDSVVQVNKQSKM